MPSFSRQRYDAIVIGSGPNGLAAAITLAEARRSVLLLEGEETIGGGMRTAALTLPGFRHDVCSSVHALGALSPFFRSLPLERHGLAWIQPPLPLAHPLEGGNAVALDVSVATTAENLGADGGPYQALVGGVVRQWPRLEPFVLEGQRLPRHPVAAARFGRRALRSASYLARAVFAGGRARALFGGLAAHSLLPLEQPPSAAFALVLAAAAHLAGWPFARGGSQCIAAALASYFLSLGGEIVTAAPVASLDELPPAELIFCDVTPRQLLRLAHFPPAFERRLRRYRYGPGVCKLDWALAGPIPWQAEACTRAGTVHLGGTLEEIEQAERAPARGGTAERPFVLLAQPSLFDSERAPAGRHVAWAYCHVPNGSDADLSGQIEAQVERFAPGFRDRILARNVLVTGDLERHNPNLVGGDIAGGAMDLTQWLARTWRGYRTPLPRVYLCSSATAPGAGVHGMCGHNAALAALRRIRR